MNDPQRRMNRLDHETLFPEFKIDREEAAVEEPVAPAPVPRSSRQPLILSVMKRLATILSEETAAIRAGEFETFSELQREKGELIRKAERLEHDARALDAVGEMNPEDLKGELNDFNQTVEGNMRAIGAVKDAITHVRTQAIRKLEDEKGDGVYSRDGEKRSLHRLSLNETQVKL